MEHTEPTTEQKYRALLGRHDWWYAYSDDYSVWAKGQRQSQEISTLQRQVDPDFEIWNEIAPAECKVVIK